MKNTEKLQSHLLHYNARQFITSWYISKDINSSAKGNPRNIHKQRCPMNNDNFTEASSASARKHSPTEQ